MRAVFPGILRNFAAVRIAIKNMVCDRCVASVRTLLAALGYGDARVGMGWAAVPDGLGSEQLDAIAQTLEAEGFELLRGSDEALVERIKAALIALARRADGQPVKLSQQLPEVLAIDYKQASAAFSAHEGRTIEKFYIAQKVEYVKELLEYGQLTVSEIAWRTGYSSVAHLSRQFKQVAGCTPTQYQASHAQRRPIDQI